MRQFDPQQIGVIMNVPEEFPGASVELGIPRMFLVDVDEPSEAEHLQRSSLGLISLVAENPDQTAIIGFREGLEEQSEAEPVIGIVPKAFRNNGSRAVAAADAVPPLVFRLHDLS